MTVTGDQAPHVEMEEAMGRTVHEAEAEAEAEVVGEGEGEAAARTTEDGTPKVS